MFVVLNIELNYDCIDSIEYVCTFPTREEADQYVKNIGINWIKWAEEYQECVKQGLSTYPPPKSSYGLHVVEIKNS